MIGGPLTSAGLCQPLGGWLSRGQPGIGVGGERRRVRSNLGCELARRCPRVL